MAGGWEVVANLPVLLLRAQVDAEPDLSPPPSRSVAEDAAEVVSAWLLIQVGKRHRKLEAWEASRREEA